MKIDRKIGMAEAIREAICEEMRRDEKVFLLGEDIGRFGGPFQVTRELIDEFGEERVRDTPVSEAAIIGAAVGAAMTGMRPVAEVQYSDFLACGMDQIVNQAAKMRLMSGGQTSVPLVLRAPFGTVSRGAQHAQSLEAWFMHTPGLKVVVPSTPYDAKGLLKTAVRDDNPVIFFEHIRLYGSKSPGGKTSEKEKQERLAGSFVPEEEYTIPFGKADIKRPGDDVTVVATMYMVHESLKAAEELAQEGISVEVVDPRTLTPLDRETIIESVRKTGRLVVVSEDCLTAGVSAELSAMVSEQVLDYMDAPVRRVAAIDTPMPFAPGCEKYAKPDKEKIKQAIRETAK